MAALFAATHPDRVERAGPVRGLRARDLGARLRVGLEGRGAQRRAWTSWSSTGARGCVAGGVAPSRMDDPEFMEWAGAARAPGRQPGDDQAHLRPDRRVRRARRAALDPRAHARAAPPRGQLHQHRALALHRRAHPRRAASSSSRAATTCSRSATARPCSARSRSSSPASATSASPTACSPRCCSPTSAAPPSARRSMGDRAWRVHARAPRRAVPARAGAPPRAARSSTPATASWPPSTAPRARSAAPADQPRRWRRSASRCEPGLHTGELEVMDGDLGGLAVHIAARVMDRGRAAARCWCRAPSRTSWWALGSSFEERGAHELRGVPGEWRLFSVG